jgi:hypothetical protein
MPAIAPAIARTFPPGTRIRLNELDPAFRLRLEAMDPQIPPSAEDLAGVKVT